jgi:serine/threonine protein kinase
MEENGVATWILMERAAMSLERFLQDTGPGGLEYDVLQHILRCVFTALNHMHTCVDREGRSMAAIHYDFKPANVLVFHNDDSPVGLDFKISDLGATHSTRTMRRRLEEDPASAVQVRVVGRGWDEKTR